MNQSTATQTFDLTSGTHNVLQGYRHALNEATVRGTLFEFSFAALDRLGLPLWTVALISEDGALSDGYGYGANDTLAQTSAWGETLEWFFAREHLRRCARRDGSYHELQRHGVAAINPVSLNLSAGSSYTHHQSLVWVEARRYPSQEIVLVPIEFAAPRYADIATRGNEKLNPKDFLAVPITNGLGAGPTLEHAIAQGALELLQRDGNSVNYRALDRGVAVQLDEVRDDGTRKLLAYLDAQGIEIIAKLATTDFGITNLYVVGYDRDPARAPHPLALSACGEAAHPNRERALAKALREFTSSRARKHFMHGPLDTIRPVAPAGYLDAFRTEALRDEDNRAFREMAAWRRMPHEEFLGLMKERVLRVESTVRFSELPNTDEVDFDDARGLLDFLAARFAREGCEILYVDFTDPASGVSVVKTIIPGFEVETMTYERIGRRNLERLLKSNSPIVGLSSPPGRAKPIMLTPHDQQAIGSRTAWFSSVAREQAIGNLYALYREPGRHVIAFAEEMNRQKQ